MNRIILDEAHVHPAIRERIASQSTDLVREVQAAVAAHDIVIVGMKQNPFPRKARKLLDTRRLPYTYLEYGGYFSEWRRRLPLKMWTGWSTFPMIFVKGMLVGGASELEVLLNNGEIERMLAST